MAGRGDATLLPVLVRTDREQDASLLLTQFDLWAAYSIEAPQVRLDRWRFAVAADGRVAVHVHPLPPLPGQRWVEQEGIAVPAGWTWAPAVEAELLRQVFGLATATWRYGMRTEPGSGLRPTSLCGPRGPR